MRNVLIIVLVLIAMPTFAQFGDIPVHENKKEINTGEPLTFEEVVQVPELTADEIYEQARMWFAESFINANNVLQVQDKEAGQLIGRGQFDYVSATFTASQGMNGYISFLVKIFVKEGRYKYIITDFSHKGYPSGSSKYGVSFGIITEDTEAPTIVKGNFKSWHQKQWDKMQTKSRKTAKVLSTTIKEYISKDKLQDNW